MKYTVRVTTTETCRYHIEANTPEEARELAVSGDYDAYETVDVAVDDVVVED